MKRNHLSDLPTTSKLTLIVVLLLLLAIILTIQRGLQKQNANTMAQGITPTGYCLGTDCYPTETLTTEASQNLPIVTESTTTSGTIPAEIQAPAQQTQHSSSDSFLGRSVDVFARLIDMSRKILAGETDLRADNPNPSPQ